MRYAAGVRPLEAGYRKVLIAPAPNAALGYMDCIYDSVYGQYKVSWHILKNGTVQVNCTIPVGCTALLRLPDGSEQELDAGSHTFLCDTGTDECKLYRATTPLTRLLDDPTAMEAIRTPLPFVAQQMEAGNMDFLSLAILDLVAHPWLGLDKAAAQQAVDALLALSIPGEN